MRMLFDTGAAMNTGNFDFHMLVMSQCPDIVDEFLQCGKDTAYDFFTYIGCLGSQGHQYRCNSRTNDSCHTIQDAVYSSWLKDLSYFLSRWEMMSACVAFSDYQLIVCSPIVGDVAVKN